MHASGDARQLLDIKLLDMKNRDRLRCIKRLLIFIIIFQFSTEIKSQEYIPLAVEGAQWIVRYDDQYTPPTVDLLWEYFASGDTCIGNKCYIKVFKRDLIPTDESPPFIPDGEYELFGFIRDDSINRKVYAIQSVGWSPCPQNEEFLMYDFSLNIGDTVDFCLIPDFFTYLIDTIYSGNYLGFDTRLYKILDMWEDFYYEGLGSYYGLFEEMFAPFKSTDQKYIYHTFLYYYCRESPCNLIVSVPELHMPSPSFQLSPNPVTDILNIKLNSRTTRGEIRLLNLYGQEVRRLLVMNGISNYQLDLTSLPSGYYIAALINEGVILEREKFVLAD